MNKCELCGEPMPAGEEIFKFHGYSGNCPHPPLPRDYEVEGVKKLLKDSTTGVDNGKFIVIDPDGQAFIGRESMKFLAIKKYKDGGLATMEYFDSKLVALEWIKKQPKPISDEFVWCVGEY